MNKIEYQIPEGYEARIDGNKVILEPKETEDERIRKGLIDYFNDFNLPTFGGLDPIKILAWLEKQGEHIKFLKSIQIGDEVTRNPDGVLVNLSQLKRVAEQGSQNLANSEKTCKDEQNPAWSEEDEIRFESTLHRMEIVGNGCAFGQLKDDIDWLKSLKERYTWKPNDGLKKLKG